MCCCGGGGDCSYTLLLSGDARRRLTKERLLPALYSRQWAVKHRPLWGGGCPGPGTPRRLPPCHCWACPDGDLAAAWSGTRSQKLVAEGDLARPERLPRHGLRGTREKRRARPNNGLLRIVLPLQLRALGLIKGTARNPTPRRPRGPEAWLPPRRTKAGLGAPGQLASTGWTLWTLSGTAGCTQGHSRGPEAGPHGGLSGSGRDEVNDGDTGRARGGGCAGVSGTTAPEPRPPRPQPLPLAGPRPRRADNTSFHAESPKFGRDARDSRR